MQVLYENDLVFVYKCESGEPNIVIIIHAAHF